MSKHDLYEMQHSPEVAEVLEELSAKISSTGAGLTLIGNRLTIRWGNELKHVHMLILEVEDGKDDYKCWECNETGDQHHFMKPHCPKCKRKDPIIGPIKEGCPQ